MHGFTYNAHPISMAAGWAVLRYLKSRRLVEAADSGREGTPAAILRREMESLYELECVGDVRGIGMLLGVEFVAERRRKTPFPAAKAFSSLVGKAAAKRGVMVYPMQGTVDGVEGDHLLIAPPAVITADEIRWTVGQLKEAIGEAASEAM